MDTTVSTSSQSPPAVQGYGRRLRGFALFSVLAALMLTLLLESLDQTVVGTAMPRIIGSLNGFDRYTWVVTAYILASVTMVPIVGKLSDQFGRKWFLTLRCVHLPAGIDSVGRVADHERADRLPCAARAGRRYGHCPRLHRDRRHLPACRTCQVAGHLRRRLRVLEWTTKLIGLRWRECSI
jgi:Major Facilitator Superfamily